MLCCSPCPILCDYLGYRRPGCQALLPMGFFRQVTGVGCHFLLHYLLQNIFITPRGTPSPHSLRPPALGNHRLLSVPMGFPVLHFISMDSYNVWPFFTEHHVYKVHPRCNLHQYLIHFYGSVRSRCADM